MDSIANKFCCFCQVCLKNRSLIIVPSEPIDKWFCLECYFKWKNINFFQT